MKLKGTVYLLHLSRKLAGHAGHYIGFTVEYDPAARVAAHRQGRGARMLAAAARAGIGFRVARVWGPVPQALERLLKRRKNAAFLCPVCRRRALARRRAADRRRRRAAAQGVVRLAG